MNNFNTWPILAVCFTVVTFIVGTMKYRLNRRKRIVPIANVDATLSLISGLLSAILQLVIVKESFRGMVQLIVNHVAEDELGWLPLLLAAMIACSFSVFYGLMCYAGKAGQVAMKIFLKFKLEKEYNEGIQEDATGSIVLFRKNPQDF